MLGWAVQNTGRCLLAVSPWTLSTELGIPDTTVATMVQSSAPRSVSRMTSLVKMRSSMKNPERTPRVMEMVLYESLLSRIGAPQLVAVTFFASGSNVWLASTQDLEVSLCPKLHFLWHGRAPVREGKGTDWSERTQSLLQCTTGQYAAFNLGLKSHVGAYTRHIGQFAGRVANGRFQASQLGASDQPKFPDTAAVPHEVFLLHTLGVPTRRPMPQRPPNSTVPGRRATRRGTRAETSRDPSWRLIWGMKGRWVTWTKVV